MTFTIASEKQEWLCVPEPSYLNKGFMMNETFGKMKAQGRGWTEEKLQTIIKVGNPH